MTGERVGPKLHAVDGAMSQRYRRDDNPSLKKEELMSEAGSQKEPSSILSVLGEIISFKITADETGGSLCVVELMAFPYNGPPPHIHHREDESFYVIDGAFSFLLGDRTFEAGPGFFCRVPKGTLHTYQNVGAEPGKALVILTPAGFEKFWIQIAKPVTNLTGPTGPPDPETIARLMSLAPKYGLEVKVP
jgi:mannose-6-phosphate isomerase-like protein (cupin superfamily)